MPPVAIQALFSPWAVMQVPLAANEASPGSAGGILSAIEMPGQSVESADV
jgi:hypothetical protein